MFEQSFIPKTAKTKRAWSVALSFSSQMAVVGIAVLIPLIATDRIPLASIRERLVEPAPPPGKRPVPPNVKIVASGKLPPQQISGGKLIEPTRIPPKAATFVDPPPASAETASAECRGCIPGAVPGSPGPGSLSRILTQPPPLPPPEVRPPAPPRAAPPKQIVRTSDVQAAQLVHKVVPPYPRLARSARVSGVVRLRGVIGTDGHIRQLELISGHPLLTQAAIESVQQWVYRPTTLAGEPVEVVTDIYVNFTLSQ